VLLPPTPDTFDPEVTDNRLGACIGSSAGAIQIGLLQQPAGGHYEGIDRSSGQCHEGCCTIDSAASLHRSRDKSDSRETPLAGRSLSHQLQTVRSCLQMSAEPCSELSGRVLHSSQLGFGSFQTSVCYHGRTHHPTMFNKEAGTEGFCCFLSVCLELSSTGAPRPGYGLADIQERTQNCFIS
jgi:hypothetical protein